MHWIKLWWSFCHKRTSRKIWRAIYFFRRKYLQMHYLFNFNRKTSYKNWLKWRRNYKNHILHILLIYKIKSDFILQNLLIVQDLWQAHYQFLSIILLKKFLKLNVKTVKRAELNKKIVSVALNIKTLKLT